MRLDAASGLWHRPEAFDSIILTEARRTFASLPLIASDVFLDLGAHIGAVSRIALERGASKVIAVEADPSNIALLRRNLAGHEVIWAAVGPAGLLYPDRRRPYLSSRLPERGRRAVRVPTLSLGELLGRFRPTVVKCDIEFGEYDLPELRALPAFVRLLAMEIHVRSDVVLHSAPTEAELRDRRQTARGLIRSIEEQGFRALSWNARRSPKPPAIHDGTGLDPQVKAIDAMWVR